MSNDSTTDSTSVAPLSVSKVVLTTDLDGTLIPLEGNSQNRTDLLRLARALDACQIDLVFVTGRHLESILDAIEQHHLPQPDWIIADVGSSIFTRNPSDANESESWVRVGAYSDHLDELTGNCSIDELASLIADLNVEGLRLQEPEKQGRNKHSYYAPSENLAEIESALQSLLDSKSLPYSMIVSVDPFNGDGLVDFLPKGVSKAYALDWWVHFANMERDHVVFAGDSRNDLAAFQAGYRTIVVKNADRKLAQEVVEVHKREGFINRLCIATQTATSGVLEGCHWFEMFQDQACDEGQESTKSRSGDISEWPLGATSVSCDTTNFLVWAPKQQSLQVVWNRKGESQEESLTRHENGYFHGQVKGVPPGTDYLYRLESGQLRPDPASRYQPTSVHEESRVVTDRGFAWSDEEWKGVPKEQLVIYEMHVGSFTAEGTFLSAISRLDELVELGVTAIELLPLAQCPGKWNWGYDGVYLFAVGNPYGTPDDFRLLVDACHQRGLSVFVDVVYNHLGPEGNYLSEFAPYFTRKYQTPWGETFNYDGRQASQVRRFVIENALMWIREYHVDGLRLDAVHFLFDESDRHILHELKVKFREEELLRNRHLHLIAEANVYDHKLLAEQADSHVYSAIWCDCLMHAVYAQGAPVLNLTHREYRPQADLKQAIDQGFIYEGPPVQRATPKPKPVTKKQESSAEHVERYDYLNSLVIGLQTHDSVGNHPHGRRLHQLTSVEFQKAAAPLVLLYPSIPIMFMGEEEATSAPFPFFVDFEDARLRRAVDRGRAAEYPQHAWDGALSPSDPNAFLRSKVTEADSQDPSMRDWYRQLLSLRKEWQQKGWLDYRIFEPLTEGDDDVLGDAVFGNDVFGFDYLVPKVGRLQIRSRLVSPLSKKPSEFKIEGKILLHSETEIHVAVVALAD